jgi:hypothetical protein
MSQRLPKSFKDPQQLVLSKKLRPFVFEVDSSNSIQVVKNDNVNAILEAVKDNIFGCYTSHGYKKRLKTDDFVFNFGCTDKNCAKALKVTFKVNEILASDGDVHFEVLEEDKKCEHETNTRNWAGMKRVELKGDMKNRSNATTRDLYTDMACPAQLESGYSTVPTIRAIQNGRSEMLRENDDDADDLIDISIQAGAIRGSSRPERFLQVHKSQPRRDWFNRAANPTEQNDVESYSFAPGASWH